MKKLTILLILGVMVVASSTSASLAATYGTATDPSYIGVGARPLGMGKAYAALADDASSIFVNPAALGRVDQMLFSSMYSNLMEEVNYTMGSITYPVGPGTLAVGYLGVLIPGIDLYTVTDLGTPETAGTADYNNSVIYLSYGARLSALTPDVMVGASLKSFSEGFKGSDLTEDGAGSGMNLDLGALYQPYSWFAGGVTIQNALEGSKMQFKGGINENLPSTVKVGINVTPLGKFGYIKSPYKLNIAADLDLNSGPRREKTLHLGCEFWPVNMLAIRAGLDQDPIAGGVQTNLTAGVGLRLGDIQFDYAYHTFYNIPENTTHFFSISFVGPFEQAKPRKDFVAYVDTPRENSITTHSDKIKIEGKVENALENDRVEVNGRTAKLDDEGRFSTSADISSFGLNKVIVKAIDAKGRTVEIEKTVIRLASFNDVTKDFWAKEPIELLATAGLVTGYPDGSFMPEKTLTRAELCTLLVKAKNIPISEKLESSFSDLSESHWAARYIEAAVDAGLVLGYPDKTFRPDAKIKRAEGITVMVRVEGLQELADELKGDAEDSRFTDIADSWAAGYILAADEAGLLKYLKASETFNPNYGFTRAEAVDILSKTTVGKARVRDLLAKESDSTIAEK
jgi:hypothetical protein